LTTKLPSVELISVVLTRLELPAASVTTLILVLLQSAYFWAALSDLYTGSPVNSE